VFLGIKTLREARSTPVLEEVPPAPTRTVFTRAMLTNLLNPKIVLFYLAFLPQFADPHRGSLALQLLLLGLVFVVLGLLVDSTIALLSGATITSSGTAPNDFYSMPLWNESSLNQPTKPVLIRIPSKDSAGVVRTLDFVLFKVQFEPINFDGPSYKNGLLLNYAGRALLSSVDEKGTALPEKAIGRLVSRPVI